MPLSDGYVWPAELPGHALTSHRNFNRLPSSHLSCPVPAEEHEQRLAAKRAPVILAPRQRKQVDYKSQVGASPRICHSHTMSCACSPEIPGVLGPGQFAVCRPLS